MLTPLTVFCWKRAAGQSHRLMARSSRASKPTWRASTLALATRPWKKSSPRLNTMPYSTSRTKRRKIGQSPRLPPSSAAPRRLSRSPCEPFVLTPSRPCRLGLLFKTSTASRSGCASQPGTSLKACARSSSTRTTSPPGRSPTFQRSPMLWWTTTSRLWRPVTSAASSLFRGTSPVLPVKKSTIFQEYLRRAVASSACVQLDPHRVALDDVLCHWEAQCKVVNHPAPAIGATRLRGKRRDVERVEWEDRR
mmetsp:Transcript_9522/g.30466  ORF Transcript_9522/g.30466 Transcript_9522/m.30466 type:complete len:250 (-) Transcript_9522:767-1516(-)